ncbi:MAG: hypothetical protein RLZZ104_793, partial [Pseudomonadota bacterium]
VGNQNESDHGISGSNPVAARLQLQSLYMGRA